MSGPKNKRQRFVRSGFRNLYELSDNVRIEEKVCRFARTSATVLNHSFSGVPFIFLHPNPA